MSAPVESPRFSSRHIAALVLSFTLPVALFALLALVVAQPAIAGHPAFWLGGIGIIAAIAVAVGANITFGAEDRINGRIDEIAGQIAALGESIHTYGDERESAGVVMGMRAAAKGSNVRHLHS